ncbi:MAG: PAS domain-containing sensor histidine kinase, partial [Pseudomonas sp.]|nr:PAS domain-containing sensor histidine kinase [Pseudomonas sp.]
MLGRTDERLPESTDPQSRTHAGIQLMLDPLGHVIEIHGLQRYGLARGSDDGSPRLLLSYLVPGSTLALEGVPADWVGHSLDLDFQCAGLRVVHTRGWVQPQGGSWLLQLLDISDLRLGSEQARSRERCTQLILGLAGQLRQCSASRLSEVMHEALRSVAQHGRVPCMALALREGPQASWYMHSTYHAFDAPQLWLPEQNLGSLLDPLGGTSPQRVERDGNPRLNDLFGNADGVLVPYSDQQGLCAWLMLGFYPASLHGPQMSESDWMQVCAALAAPLLDRLREQQHLQQSERMEALQGLLGTGWWEWSSTSELLELAPQLAINLDAVAEPQAMTRQAWLALFHPAERDELSGRFNELLEHDKELLLFARVHEPQATEPARWYRIQGQVLGSGTRRRIVGFMLDVSDIKNQQQQVAAAHARLDNLIASS